jgi:hypothetical protein
LADGSKKRHQPLIERASIVQIFIPLFIEPSKASGSFSAD